MFRMQGIRAFLIPLFIISALLLNASAAEPPARQIMLVTPDWLSAHLPDSDLVLLHIGRSAAYLDEGHIPGARLVPVSELLLRESGDLADEMPEAEAMRAVFETLGVGDDSRIVLCPADEHALYFTGRILLALDMLGLGGNAMLLDGGLPLWRVQEHPLSKKPAEPTPGEITAALRSDLNVSAAWLRERLDSPALAIVDARPEDRYSGRSEDHHALRQGHIAGAVNLPFFELAREDEPARFLPVEELADRFEQRGVSAGDIVVVYCGTGIWAGQVYLAARVLGYDVRFYDGSYQDWSADPNLPVTGPVSASLLNEN